MLCSPQATTITLSLKSGWGHLLLHDPWHMEHTRGSFKVDDLWGIVHRYEKIPIRYGIRSALDLTLLPLGWIKKQMTVQGLRTWHELNSRPMVGLVPTPLDVPKNYEGRTVLRAT